LDKIMVHVKDLIKSFSHACRGVKTLVKDEQSFRLQILAALVVGIFLLIFPLSVFEMIVVLLMVALVLILEMINSIFERLVDTFKPRIHPVVGEIKDIMAATVLVASIFSAIIGVIIFLPHFLDLLVG